MMTQPISPDEGDALSIRDAIRRQVLKDLAGASRSADAELFNKGWAAHEEFTRTDPPVAMDEVVAVLHEAELQLEYLDEKFQPTGTTPAVRARISALLTRIKDSSNAEK